MSAVDTDQEMSNGQETANQNHQPLLDHGPPQTPERTNMPSTRFTVRVQGQMNYAGALKRTAEQAEGANEDGQDEQTNHEDAEETAETTLEQPSIRASGPVKGLDNKIFANLDIQVREAWESQAQEAVFIHYLNGGYNPNIAQNVHIIVEDLKGKSSLFRTRVQRA